LIVVLSNGTNCPGLSKGIVVELIGLQAYADLVEASEVVGRRQCGAMDVVELQHQERGVLIVVVGGDGAVVVPGAGS
jgi:hypothetical protein